MYICSYLFVHKDTYNVSHHDDDELHHIMMFSLETNDKRPLMIDGKLKMTTEARVLENL